MKTIQVPNRDQVDAASQGIFDNLKKALGTVPNLYATIGYSSNALGAYLTYSQATDNGVFNKKEAEAIKLAVSEVNECAYCLAAHTALAKLNGFTEEETLALRAASISDQKLKVITQLAKEIAQEKGKASEEAKQAFFEAGYDEKALIDLLAIVVDITFTNFAHRLTQVPVDFPTAKPLGTEVAV